MNWLQRILGQDGAVADKKRTDAMTVLTERDKLVIAKAEAELHRHADLSLAYLRVDQALSRKTPRTRGAR